MGKEETSFNFLQQFLPPNTYYQVEPYFSSHVIHLTITHERKSVLGDYRTPTKEKPYHRISINANLNPYSFLITLLHEIAHMTTYLHFKHSAPPHGKEWKTQFRHILIPFIGKQIFPPNIEKALLAYIHNPAASTCTDPRLFKALYRYDEHKEGWLLVDDLELNEKFAIESGQVFQKIEHLRTRSRCKEVKTGKMYYFMDIIEVKKVG
jgi:SprT protein